MISFTSVVNGFSFQISSKWKKSRTGVITTPHGKINTPAFIPVATQASLKALTPEQLEDTGAQATLANAYHLYLRPGVNVIEKAGGLGGFMNWSKPTFTDSGGFQVMSLGSGLKKVVDMSGDLDEPVSEKDRLAQIDDEGVTFKSHIDGSSHRFTPEVSMQVQHKIGADIMFAFDELTTLKDGRKYQEESLKKRTHPWAERSLTEHKKLQGKNSRKSYQALFGVVQGAQFEDLRRKSAKFLANFDFDGFGLGGAFKKDMLGNAVSWMTEELPEEKPRHMLGISEPEDIFECIEQGVDTFDCVSPSRVARNGAVYLSTGRVNIVNQKYKSDSTPIDKCCDCYTCQNFTRGYLNHLFRSKEILGKTLATIHNQRFIVKLVEDIRTGIEDNNLVKFKSFWLKKYYSK